MSRRKQSNPKPLKSGDEETWTEDNEKATKTSFEDTVTSKESAPSDPDESSSPTKEDESCSTVKIEPTDSECGSDRSELSDSVIKRTTCANEIESKSTAVIVIKNEPIASPAPANSVSLGEQEYSTLSQNLQTTLTGTRYYPTVINAAASDVRYRPETLDIRQGFLCPPCGIRFSSLSTLEAHQTYYCSHRQNKRSKGGTESEGEDGRALSVSGGCDQDEGSSGENMSCGEPSVKSAKTGKQYRCTHCSYSADKKVSLNRHMRMHSASPASSVQNDSDSSVPPVDRYCQECDIRFSNLKTFRAHKLHYCSTRNVIMRASSTNPSSSPNLPVESRITSSLPLGLPNHGTSQPFVALPTNPVLIVPYSLIQAGNLLSGSITSTLSSQEAVYLLLPDGNIQMVTQGIVNQNVRPREANSPVLQPLLTTNSSNARKEAPSPKNMKTPSIPTTNGALDLRTRRESNASASTAVDASEEEKENRLVDEQVDHEDIVCAPSIPLILSTSSTCSTPSPVPLSPGSHSGSLRPDKLCSPSPKPVIKAKKKLTNGVVPKPGKLIDSEDKKNDHFATQKAATAVSLERVAGFNLTEVLMAAASPKELQFTPEMIPHLTAIQQMSSVKRAALNPIANMPLLLPPVSPGSGVVPDLIDPTILTLLNSELARRLATGSVSPSVPQYVMQGTWKCDDCNIGFCKYENYVAHKKHYCSTRKVPEAAQLSDDSVKTSPIGSPSTKSTVASPSQSLAKENTSPIPQPQQQQPPPPPLTTSVIQNSSHRPAFSQFVCSMCGIKYSSLDNLTTHQTFYCPNRLTVVADGEKSSLKCCSKCKMLLPVDQLPTHQCAGISNTTGWKCPCCFVVCNSTNAIQKHFESHTGVKAFLCTICNYKGNTIRGMRTHIRVHFDKRNGDIMEENYITCLMEDSSSVVSSADENSVDKSLKKSPLERAPITPPNEEKLILAPAPASVTGPVVVENSSSPTAVQSVEEEDEYIEVDELPNIKSELIRNEIAASTSVVEENSTLKVDCKSPKEVVDDLSLNNNKKYDSKYCKSCDISFKYLPTYIAHKKYYCSSHLSETTSPLSGAESIVVPTNMATAAHIV